MADEGEVLDGASDNKTVTCAGTKVMPLYDEVHLVCAVEDQVASDALITSLALPVARPRDARDSLALGWRKVGLSAKISNSSS